ncbi:alkanesulfonate monooxygenase [Calycina marina]|uniref:Alkanesulfonate monooxygenase n=1 Tax=Calycina marina TaxID=1763456 RepID=A0A9P8CGP9_9HELO|nr:alkanesulfonate monooxygenase [Calycina marina]
MELVINSIRKAASSHGFWRPVSLHIGAWRYSGSYPDASFNLKRLTYFFQKLEGAKFDSFFMADHLAVLNLPVETLKRSHTVTSFAPFTHLSSLSMVTERIGSAAAASTTYDELYYINRRFASLDHINNGRAAWNVNFGLDEYVQHNERYKRARKFYDAVNGFWDSSADDVFMHVLNHKVDDLKASQSEQGRQLAVQMAKLVFCSPRDVETLRIVCDSFEDAQAKILHLDSLEHCHSAISSLSITLRVEASDFSPNDPLPDDIPETNASKTSQAGAVALGKKENLTVRQFLLAQRYGGIADEMKIWLDEEAAHGFTVVLHFLPQGIDDVADRLVPGLQKRGLFRKEYEGIMLREHFGLPRPKNQFLP